MPNGLLEKYSIIGQRLLRKRSVRTAWYILVIANAVLQALLFLRLRHQNVEFFHSTSEALLVAALVIVMLLGVFVKSRQSAHRKSQ